MNTSWLIRNVVWNGMLALIPVVLAYVIILIAQHSRAGVFRNLVVTALSIVWLIFLPNTCYLLTEWRHFLKIVDANDLFLRSGANNILFVKICALWLFYFLYSTFGMITFTLAIRPIKQLVSKRGATIWFWTISFFVVLSLGVYLGLVLRFNSWDFASRPGIIWNAIIEVGGRPYLSAFITAFGVFLWISYEMIDIWIDAIADRLGRTTGRAWHLSR